MTCRKFIPFLVILAGAFAGSRPAIAQTIQLAGTGSVEYQLVHKFHKISATSKALAVRGTAAQIAQTAQLIQDSEKSAR